MDERNLAEEKPPTIGVIAIDDHHDIMLKHAREFADSQEECFAWISRVWDSLRVADNCTTVCRV